MKDPASEPCSSSKGGKRVKLKEVKWSQHNFRAQCTLTQQACLSLRQEPKKWHSKQEMVIEMMGEKENKLNGMPINLTLTNNNSRFSTCNSSNDSLLSSLKIILHTSFCKNVARLVHNHLHGKVRYIKWQNRKFSSPFVIGIGI